MIAFFGWCDDCATDACRRSVGTGDVNLAIDIEKIQRRALRISLPLMSYREARNFTGIPLLKARRETLCEQFFKKNENNDKLSELLHHKATADYDMRPRCKYNNYLCRTERFRKSFFPQIISKENSK